jgi:hypothetical protein
MTQIHLWGLLTLALTATSAAAGTIPVDFAFTIDDYGVVSIDGSVVASYDNPAAAGYPTATVDLTPGYHTISIDYANQFGTNYLALYWQLPGAPTISIIPLGDFSSLDQNGNTVSGLRADYYSSLGGSYLFTIYGEGPIDNGALSFTSEIYEGQPGLWAGVFGPSALFAENLSGQIYIPGGAPEPSTALLVVVSLLACFAARSALPRLRRVRQSRL